MPKLTEKEFAQLVTELGPDATEEQILAAAKEREAQKYGLLDRVVEKVTTPLTTKPAELAEAAADRIDQRAESDSASTGITLPNWMPLVGGTELNKGFAKGLAAGVTEGVGNLASQLTSPLDIALTALGLGGASAARRGAQGVARVMRAGERAALAPLIAKGGIDAASGIAEGDPAKVGEGAALGLMAGVGAALPMTPKMPKAGKPGVSTPATVPTPESPSIGTAAASPSSPVYDLPSAVKETFDLHSQHGGATFNLQKGSLAGTPHFAVAKFPERTQIIEGQLTPEALQAYVEQHADVLSDPAHSIGTWFNKEDGKTYLDITETLASRDEALAAGTQRGEKAIFDLQSFEEIPVPQAAVGQGIPASAEAPYRSLESANEGLSSPSAQPSTAEEMLQLEHRSGREDLVDLDPDQFGTGQAGAERRRQQNDPENWVNRSYTTVKGGFVEPRFKGSPEYDLEVPKSRIYNLLADEQGILAKAREEVGNTPEAFTLAERRIKEAGYAGYQLMGHEDPFMRDTVTLFERMPVKRRGAPAGAESSPAAAVGVGGHSAPPASALPPHAASVESPRQTTAPDHLPQGRKESLGDDSTSGLPMDEASRMQRAREQGFDVDTPAWHGTEAKNDIQEFKVFNPNGGLQVLGTNVETPRSGAFFSSDPDVSRNFGSKVEPYALRLKNVADVDRTRGGDISTVVQEFADSLDPHGPDRDIWLTARHAREPWMLFDGDAGVRFVEFLKSKGYDGARFIEPGTDNAVTTVVLDAKNIRHRDKAQFDPAKTNSANVLASVAAPAAMTEDVIGEGGLIDFGDDDTNNFARGVLGTVGLLGMGKVIARAPKPKGVFVGKDGGFRAVGPSGREIKIGLAETNDNRRKPLTTTGILPGWERKLAKVGLREGQSPPAKPFQELITLKNGRVRFTKEVEARLRTLHQYGEELFKEGGAEWLENGILDDLLKFLPVSDPKVAAHRLFGATSPAQKVPGNLLDTLRVAIRTKLRQASGKLNLSREAVEADLMQGIGNRPSKSGNVQNALTDQPLRSYDNADPLPLGKTEDLAKGMAGLVDAIPFDMWWARAIGLTHDAQPANGLSYKLLYEAGAEIARRQGVDPFPFMAKVWAAMKHLHKGGGDVAPNALARDIGLGQIDLFDQSTTPGGAAGRKMLRQINRGGSELLGPTGVSKRATKALSEDERARHILKIAQDSGFKGLRVMRPIRTDNRLDKAAYRELVTNRPEGTSQPAAEKLAQQRVQQQMSALKARERASVQRLAKHLAEQWRKGTADQPGLPLAKPSKAELERMALELLYPKPPRAPKK